MQKTKLGISVGIFGALLFFAAFFGGYMSSIILAGYVLLIEDNVWLKRAAVKAVAVLVCFSLINALVGFIPDIISFINSIARIFEETFYVQFLDSFVTFIYRGLELVEKALFILLGLKALTQGTVAVPVVDKLIEKHVG